LPHEGKRRVLTGNDHLRGSVSLYARSATTNFCIQMFSGNLPFHELNDYKVAAEVLEGGRPRHPGPAARRGLTPIIWSFMQECWCQDRSRRPPADRLISVVQEAGFEVPIDIHDYRAICKRVTDAERALELKSHALAVIQSECQQLRTSLGEANEDRALALQMLDDVRSRLQTTVRELETTRQELAKQPKDESMLILTPLDSPVGPTVDNHLVILHTVNDGIYQLARRLGKATSSGAGEIGGTICRFLNRRVWEVFFFGLEPIQDATLQDAGRAMSSETSFRQWKAATSRTCKSLQTIQHKATATSRLQTDLMNEIACDVPATAEVLSADDIMRSLICDVCEHSADLAQNLACDTALFRVTYFPPETEFNAEYMALRNRTDGGLPVRRTEQFGLVSDYTTVHLKAVVFCS